MKRKNSWIERDVGLIVPMRRKIVGKMFTAAAAATGTLKDVRAVATRLRKQARKGAYHHRIMKCHVTGKGRAYAVYYRKTGKVFK